MGLASQRHARETHGLDANDGQADPVAGAVIPAMAGNNNTLFADPNADVSAFFAGGGSGPNTYATADPLPSGLTLDGATGVFSGTIGAAQEGTYPVTVTKTNNRNVQVSSNEFNIVISV